MPEPIKEKKRSNKLGWFAVILSLSAAAGTGAAAWQGYQVSVQLKQDNQTLVQSLNSAQQQVGALEDKIRTQQSDYQTQQANFKQALEASQLASVAQLKGIQQQMLDELEKLDRSEPNDWVLAEVKFLGRKLEQRLWLDKDIPGSIDLLNVIQQRLLSLNIPGLQPTLSALEGDKQVLKSLPQIHLAVTLSQLNGLVRLVDDLPLKGDPAHRESKSLELSDNLADWKENLNKSFDFWLDSFIRINKHDGDAVALLAPEQAAYLKENLKTRLLLAQLAAQQGQQKEFDSQLQDATSWINTYFVAQAQNVDVLRQGLGELMGKPVAVTLPTRLDGIEALANIQLGIQGQQMAGLERR